MEYKVGNYFVDGYDPVSNSAFEHNGAVFHGCPCCTEPDDLVPFEKITMAQAYENWGKKLEYLCGHACRIASRPKKTERNRVTA